MFAHWANFINSCSRGKERRLHYKDVNLGLELGGCNNEVAALQTDHYNEVPLTWLYVYT